MNDRNSNNPPEVVVEFTREEAKFVLANAEVLIVFGLNAMQNVDMSREAVEKLVGIMEKQKILRTKMKKALSD